MRPPKGVDAAVLVQARSLQAMLDRIGDYYATATAFPVDTNGLKDVDKPLLEQWKSLEVRVWVRVCVGVECAGVGVGGCGT